MRALSISPRCSKRSRAQPAGIPAKYLKSEAFMIQEQLLFCRNSTTGPFPLPGSAPHGRGCPAGERPLFAGGRSRAGKRPLRPCRSRSGWISPAPGGARRGRRLLFPPGTAVRAGHVPSAWSTPGAFWMPLQIPYGRICEESAWQLPAHNSYIRDTPQLPLPDTTRPIVDLFAAETGACWR